MRSGTTGAAESTDTGDCDCRGCTGTLDDADGAGTGGYGKVGLWGIGGERGSLNVLRDDRSVTDGDACRRPVDAARCAACWVCDRGAGCGPDDIVGHAE